MLSNETLNEEGLLVEGPIPAPSRSDSVQKVIESVPGLADTYVIGLMRQVRSPVGRQSTPIRASASQESRGQKANEMKLTEPERLAVAMLGESIRLAKASAWPSVLVVQASDGISPALTQAFESFKVPLLYVPLKSERPEFYFEIDGHWNEAGHLYVSEQLSDLIVERGVL